ncbi:hypothetical protein ADIS_3893 [Lunatimonas lonarensis]|uniref:Uncharacterized protein n=1 Tax=Lunatimonas lonarensis TaxID=1232681 RepID=R7ZNF3_9BACT|nr:hypothetical protein ADIS_3893 [Lunatimonas lonarensis]
MKPRYGKLRCEKQVVIPMAIGMPVTKCGGRPDPDSYREATPHPG